MPDLPYLSAIESSAVRVLLVIRIALLLPLVFDKSKSSHRAIVFAVAGLLSLRYLWWRATDTVAPLGWRLDCAASWSLLAIEAAAT